MAEDFTLLESGAARLGLTLNRSKCEVAGLTDKTRSILAARGVTLKEVPLEDLVLLGSPVLPGRGVDTVLASKREDLETLASRLPLMPAYDSLFLLRNVVSTPRLVYMLRTGAPARAASKELGLYDEVRCGQPYPATPQRGPRRMRGGSKLRCQYDGGDWRFVVLSCWHQSAYLASAF